MVKNKKFIAMWDPRTLDDIDRAIEAEKKIKLKPKTQNPKVMKSNKLIIAGYVSLLLLILAAINLAKAQEPLVGNSYEYLIRELGEPESTQQITESITVLVYFNAQDFFYYDAESKQVITQVSYVSRRQRARVMKSLTQRLDYSEGWYLNSEHNIKVRVIAENKDNRLEVVIQDNPQAIAMLNHKR